MIIVSGENVVDLLPPPGRDTAPGTAGSVLRPALGGGPANTAVVAAVLGAPCAFTARFGHDIFGTRFRDRLLDAGVDLRWARTMDAPSALAIATIDPGGGAAFDFWLDGAADFAITDPADLPVPGPGDILHTGSLAAFWPPGADTIEAWLAMHRDHVTAITIDVNLRQIVLAKQRDARARLSRLVRLAHVVKASDDDLALAYPGVEPLASARAWLSEGGDGPAPRLVVVTHGARGATALVRGMPDVTVPAPVIAVDDTIGAGDAVMGALLTRLHELGPDGVIAALPETLRFVCAVAALACTRPGAYAPTIDEVAALIDAQGSR